MNELVATYFGWDLSIDARVDAIDSSYVEFDMGVCSREWVWYCDSETEQANLIDALAAIPELRVKTTNMLEEV